MSEAAPNVSVIIPTLNEARRIERQLHSLEEIPGLGEVIVVDGGSTDGSASALAAFPKVRVLPSERGRARQMNTGAQAATGRVLLFLHADVQLPKDAATWIARALASADVVGGAFRTWTISDSGGWWPGPLLHLADLRSRYSSLPYGDQAIFVRADAFRAIGGFPDQPLMEDLELGRRLRSVGRLITGPARVQVSGRRFEARPFCYTLLVNVFPLLYRLGVSPQRLAQLYGNPR